jgi:CHAD domain-containing protein
MIAAELAKMPQGTRTDINLGQNCPMSNEAAAKALNVSPMTVKTAKGIKRDDPALADDVKQGKTKLSTAAKKAAALKSRPKVTTAKKGPTNVEQKRHDERMKSARYKLEAFIRYYSDMAEWKEVIEAIKTQLGAKHV